MAIDTYSIFLTDFKKMYAQILCFATILSVLIDGVIINCCLHSNKTAFFIAFGLIFDECEVD